MLFLVGRRFTGASKALTFGAAAGLGYGLQAAVTKTFVTELGGGVLALLSSWSVYVLIISAVTGFALQQSSLKTGVLAPAMASSNSVTLFSSVILGIAVYGETLSKTGTAHTGSTVIGLVVAVVGIAFLAGSEAPRRRRAPPTRHRRHDVLAWRRRRSRAPPAGLGRDRAHAGGGGVAGTWWVYWACSSPWRRRGPACPSSAPPRSARPASPPARGTSTWLSSWSSRPREARWAA